MSARRAAYKLQLPRPSPSTQARAPGTGHQHQSHGSCSQLPAHTSPRPTAQISLPPLGALGETTCQARQSPQAPRAPAPGRAALVPAQPDARRHGGGRPHGRAATARAGPALGSGAQGRGWTADRASRGGQGSAPTAEEGRQRRARGGRGGGGRQWRHCPRPGSAALCAPGGRSAQPPGLFHHFRLFSDFNCLMYILKFIYIKL